MRKRRGRGEGGREGGRKGGKRMSTRIRVLHLLADLLDADYCLYLTFRKLFSFFRDVMVVARKLSVVRARGLHVA